MFTGRTWELFWPWLVAAAVVVAWLRLGSPFPQTPDNLFSSSATVASILASFLGVSKAIILTIKHTPIYKALREYGRERDLFRFLRAGIWTAVAFACLSVLGFFVSAGGDPKVSGVFNAVWIFFGAAAVFCYVRITNIMFKLLDKVN
ncbi:MAG: hypothetical protein JWM36_3228 [Hyphomicrobiales bacterium]|nr:hypothetical protein [Hyphomicrobiales bacterium]